MIGVFGEATGNIKVFASNSNQFLHRWPLSLSGLHVNCPGCVMESCDSLIKSTISSSFQSICHLELDNSNSFVPISEKYFCSSTCQSWMEQFFHMTESCPHFCDLVDKSKKNLCLQLESSIDDFNRWSIQCQPFGHRK